MQITIVLPKELYELLANDSNLSLVGISVIENTVTIYDARNNRYEYSTHFNIEVTMRIISVT